MSEAIQRPWALMRHHAGWADVFRVDVEAGETITGAYVDRETVGGTATYSVRAVLARFATLEAAQAAREAAISEWRKHDDAVHAANQQLRDVEKAREQAWLACLRGAPLS